MKQFLRIFLVFPVLFSHVSLFKVRKIPLQTVDLETVSDNFGAKIWQHDGFDHMSGSQINEKLNLRLNVTSKLLIASGDTSAHLQSVLKNYEHTFLTIKFSTIIGKVKNESVPKMELSSIPVIKPTTERETVTKAEEENQESTENTHGHSEKETSSNVASSIQKPKDTKEVSSNTSLMKAKDSEKSKKITAQKLRRKRNIDISSQEILQIHKIIKMAKKAANADNNTGSKTFDENPRVTLELRPNQFTERSIADIDASISTVEAPSKINDKINEDTKNSYVDAKLNYKTWRASFDKNYRPPGFYFLVDDQVIFDNWLGMWDRRNVLGRVTPSSLKRNWNETEIQFQFDEPPKKDIKISFEWDPIEKGSYILLDNIEISTFGVQQEIPIANPNGNNFGNAQSNNNNLTVYIVVKQAPVSQSHNEPSFVVSSADTSRSDAKVHIDTSADDKISHSEVKKLELTTERSTESPKEKKLANDLLELIKTVQNNTTKENDAKLKENKTIATTTPKPETSAKSKENKGNKPSKRFSDDKTGLIVLIVFIIMGTLILITLLHRKMKENKNPNKIGGHC